MKFARYLRSQNEKQIEHAFQDAESRLFDDTYTKDEVQEMLLDLKKIVKCDMEADLISFSHNNVLMLQQLFKQAEKWYLRLQIDISELQNQELLGLVRKLEAEGPSIKREVEPESAEELEKSSVALLRMEIERIKQDNERLSNIIQEAEDRADLYREEKNKLSEKLTSAHKEIGNYKLLLERPQSRSSDSSVVKEMEEKLKAVETLLSIKDEENSSSQEKLKMELLSTKEKMNQVEAQLQLAEMELERKFSETKAYANMKQILMNKNEQIKRLREIVQKHEPDFDEIEPTED
ncbi:UNVERIFIED_CONTAM: hypothetical protein PYX00_001031 [Menopon gallinae]|uniref:Leucine zipper transcription factor-like protein 1 n=1 Tax=Menopon gallinae TaxID=328185 RepID=A0AAW2IAX3_9NEOP